MRRVVYKIKIWTGKTFRLGLRFIFGFDRWHVFTLTERVYAQDIISFCNNRATRFCFAEIGCGLGDIIRNVHFVNRFGYDMDAKVLKAAAFINTITAGRKIHFSSFTFPESILLEKYDVIVMVNWIHHIAPAILRKKIEDYVDESLNNEGCLILDTVQDKDYEFNHDIKFLSTSGKFVVTRLGAYERQREIWVLQKNT